MTDFDVIREALEARGRRTGYTLQYEHPLAPSSWFMEFVAEDALAALSRVETELAETRGQRDEWENNFATAYERAEAAEAERDAAVFQRDQWEEAAKSEAKESVWWQRAEIAEAERDKVLASMQDEVVQSILVREQLAASEGLRDRIILAMTDGSVSWSYIGDDTDEPGPMMTTRDALLDALEMTLDQVFLASNILRGHSAQPKEIQAVWLVERGQSENHTPTVWCATAQETSVITWVTDANFATSFATKADAESFIFGRLTHPTRGPSARATEHKWFSYP
jgi:hypothetical protein